MDKVDCIVVGAGPGGSACALALARKGIKTVLVERGNYAGEKNMASFVLATNALETIIPDFRESAPYERICPGSSVVMLYEKDYIDFRGRHNENYENPRLYTAYRSRFDKWFAEQAEKEGAEFIRGVKVDGLIKENGKVTGIRAGNDELRANVVVGADGLHSLVSREAGLYEDDASRYMLGLKEVIALPPDIIEERFNLQKNEGAVIDGIWGDEGWLFTLYTNNDAVSLCLFCRINTLKEGSINMRERFEDFKRHPYIETRIKGGQLKEYGAHMLADGGRIKMNKLYTDGVLLCGEAGGLMSNLWIGVPTCMISGIKAAEAVAFAKSKGAYDAKTLSCYKRFLYETGLPRMIYDAKKMSDFLIKSGNKKMATFPPGLMRFSKEFEDNMVDFTSPEHYPLLTGIYDNLAAEFIPGFLQKPLGYLTKGVEKAFYGYKNLKIRMSV